MSRLEKVVSEGTFVGGRTVEAFEEDLAKYLGVKHCVAVGNGLDALTFSLLSLGVGPKDEVIVPSYSFMATWIAVNRVGATAVAVDVNAETGLIELENLRHRISRRTRVLMPVHLYGRPVDLAPVREYLRQEGIHIVEDCAQSIGASLDGVKTGAIGTIGAFSFYPTKNLGGLGDGGAITTNDDVIAEHVRSLRSYGFDGSRHKFRRVGFNSRLDSINATALSYLLGKLDQENSYRAWQAGIYDEALEASGVNSRKHMKSDRIVSAHHHFPVLIQDRSSFQQRMREQYVETDVHYPYTIEAFGRLVGRRDLRIAERNLRGARQISARVVTLPIGSWLSEEDTFSVARALTQSLSP